MKTPLAKSKVFQKICRDAAVAAGRFDMLTKGDRVLVGISGGEDSLTLMHVLTELQRRSPFHFDIIGATVDLQFGTFKMDILRDYAAQYNWQLETVSLDGYSLMKEKGAEDRPCALCSRLRRGKLHGLADQLNCNKIALGQQLDDLCVSLLLAMFRGGGLKTMGANVPADAATKRLIRPLCLVTKTRIHEAALIADYPKIKSCPYEEQLQRDGDRFYLEQLLNTLDARFKDVRSAMLHAMGDVRLAHLLDTRYWHADDVDPDAGKL
ncbi:MAG: hypothetical protein IKP58_08580 [Victivallales bacterium]|nr:hypothetical protein [Victivallales bacterium]